MTRALGPVLVIALAAAFSSSSLASPTDARILDRTLLCATALTGGLRQIEVRADSGIRTGASWKQLAFATVATGSIGSRVTALENSLAWITAAKPGGGTTMDIGFNLAYPHTDGTLALSRAHCRASSVKVTLTTEHLHGARAGVFGDAFDCAAPRRVLVRVRGVFRSPSRLHGEGVFLRTNSPLREARLAVRDTSGRPLAYADVLESGRARLFVSNRCSAK
jgi:hypothetical protein